MTKLLKILTVLLFVLPFFVHAQSPVIGAGGVNYVSVAPSGACSQWPPVQVLNSTGNIYTCDNGVWATTGGGGTIVAPGANTNVPYNCSGILCANGNFTTDGNGNANLSGTFAAGATNPVTIGGASGSCAGLYAKADGTGCGSPSSFTAGGDLGGTSSSQTVLGLTHVTNAAIPVNVSAPSLTSPAATSATDSASLGPELTTSGTCSGTGWTGTYPNYVAPGTTAALTCTGFTSGSYYQIVTGITGNAGGGTVTVAIGTAQTATSSTAASSTLTFGPKANGTSLTYTPTAAFNGTIAISAKKINPITTFSYTGEDSTGAVSTTMLYQGLASLHNIFEGGGGTYNTTGSYNSAQGYNALYSNTTGNYNSAQGYNVLYSNTTGNYNSAQGYQAGQFISDGSTANATSSNSVYLGANTEAKASGDTNENVIGNGAVGNGSNTSTVGNTATVGTWLNGTQHITATAPITSAGTIAAYSTNAGGEITGLSAATSVTITFANSGWTNAAFCTANASTTLATNVYNSAQSNTAVTFTFPSLTGNLFYHCEGN